MHRGNGVCQRLCAQQLGEGVDGLDVQVLVLAVLLTGQVRLPVGQGQQGRLDGRLGVGQDRVDPVHLVPVGLPGFLKR